MHSILVGPLGAIALVTESSHVFQSAQKALIASILLLLLFPALFANYRLDRTQGGMMDLWNERNGTEYFACVHVFGGALMLGMKHAPVITKGNVVRDVIQLVLFIFVLNLNVAAAWGLT